MSVEELLAPICIFVQSIIIFNHLLYSCTHVLTFLFLQFSQRIKNLDLLTFREEDPSSNIKETMSSPLAVGVQNEDEDSVALSDCSDENNDALGHKNQMDEERKNLARRENKMVSYLRVAVYLVVLVTAVLVCVGVFIYTRNGEEHRFETEFAAYAAKLVESFHDSVESKIGAIHTFSTSFTAYALATGSSFPNVTVPDFAMLGANMRVQSGAVVVNWMPLVTDEDRAGWEEYAYQNRHWIMPAFFEDLGYKAAQDARFGITKAPTEAPAPTPAPMEAIENKTRGESDEDGYHYRIYSVKGDDDVEPDGSGPFLVLWQLSPVLPVIQYLVSCSKYCLRFELVVWTLILARLSLTDRPPFLSVESQLAFTRRYPRFHDGCVRQRESHSQQSP